MWFSIPEHSAWAPWPAVVVAIEQILATHFGIRAARLMPPIGRGDYFSFAFKFVLLLVLAFAGFVSFVILTHGGEPLFIGGFLLFPITDYFLVRATARRLIDIGWSPLWAWLLLGGVFTPFITLLLMVVPGRRDAGAVPAA